MDVLHLIVNELDELGQTPIYLLCMKGHGRRAGDAVAKEHAHRVDYVKLLVKGINDKDLKIKDNPNNLAKWLFKVS